MDWIMEMQHLDIDLRHMSGKSGLCNIPDAISRRPDYDALHNWMDDKYGLRFYNVYNKQPATYNLNLDEMANENTSWPTTWPM